MCQGKVVKVPLNVLQPHWLATTQQPHDSHKGHIGPAVSPSPAPAFTSVLMPAVPCGPPVSEELQNDLQ